MNRSFTLRPAWTPLNIGLMVLGFVLFWPLGLAMLAYMIWGERWERDWKDGKFNFGSCAGHGSRTHGFRGHGFGPTGNVAFDEYRTRELKRLEEERRKLDEMRREFDEFLTNLRRARDQEEFDRFVNGRGARPTDDNDTGTGQTG